MTEQDMLNQLLATYNATLQVSKQYIDQSSTADRAYVDAKLETALNTTDLAAKLELLNQINDILDGDNATAGFQAWLAEVAKLNDLAARMTVAEGDIVALQQGLDDITANLGLLSTSLSQRITDEVAALNATITTAVDGVAQQVLTIEQQMVADKASQVATDAEQAGRIASTEAIATSLTESLQTEITDRNAADAAIGQRVGAAETRITATETALANTLTKEQFVAGIGLMLDSAKSVFRMNPDGTPFTP